MIVVARTIDIRDGQAMAATEHALKVASYLRETYDWDIQVMRNVAGQVNQLHWVTNFDSMANFEVAADKLTGDEKLGQMIAEGIELYHGSSTRDSFFRTVS